MPEEEKVEDDKQDLEKEKADIENLMTHLEDEYRKAEISEKNYKELKERYTQQLQMLVGGESSSEETTAEETPTEPVAEENSEEIQNGPQESQVENMESEESAGDAEEAKEPEEPQEENVENTEQAPEEKSEEKEQKKKGGFFGGLFKKKEKNPEEEENKNDDKKDEKKQEEPKEEEIEFGNAGEMSPEAIEKLAAQAAAQQGGGQPVADTEVPAETSGSGTSDQKFDPQVEVEKLKVMIDTFRDTTRSMDDSIRSLAESIGEMRSLVFQTDGTLKETTLKLDKLEDDVAGLRPKEIDKRFKDIAAASEKTDMTIEKFDRKVDDVATKTNNVYDMLKTVGGIENLISLNKDLQVKVDDIKEALKYTERLAFKTEKIFIDLNKSMEDMVVYKSKQESLDEAIKDVLKSIDTINVTIQSLPTKRDLDMIKGDMLVLKKQMEEVEKLGPVLQTKMPENITALRKEKENISLFLETLEDSLRMKAITVSDYNDARTKNLQKLAAIDNQLKIEWDKISAALAAGVIPTTQTVAVAQAPPVHESHKRGRHAKGKRGRRHAEPAPQYPVVQPVPQPIVVPMTSTPTEEITEQEEPPTPAPIAQPAIAAPPAETPAETQSQPPAPDANQKEKFDPVGKALGKVIGKVSKLGGIFRRGG